MTILTPGRTTRGGSLHDVQLGRLTRPSARNSIKSELNPVRFQLLNLPFHLNHELHHFQTYQPPPPPPPLSQHPPTNLLDPHFTPFLHNRTSPPPLIIKSSSPPLPLLKTTFIAALTTTTLFLSRCNAIAISIPPPPQTIETTVEPVSDGEKERKIESLRTSIEIKIKNNKLDEAMNVVDNLIELDPNEVEWELLKSHLYIYNGDQESAKIRFNEIIREDPFRVEAYHGLVMAASQDEDVVELKGIEARIEEWMRLAKEGGRKSELRDFRLLIAQVWVIEGRYDAALEVYEELVKDEPRDFRPYLCRGIIYTLLRRNGEAEKSFGEYRRLVPEGHPYARYFDDNMIGTKLYAQKLDKERAGMKV